MWFVWLVDLKLVHMYNKYNIVHTPNKVASGMAEPNAERRCWYFSLSRGCSIAGAECKYEHACNSCGKPNHSMLNCRSMKPEVAAELK